MTRLTLRVDFGEGRAIGPGKARLLELIGQTGSISAAGRAMGMSYRRAWLLVASLNATFAEPAVITRGGGAGGGGAALTPSGRAVLAAYRDIERLAAEAAAPQMERLRAALASIPAAIPAAMPVAMPVKIRPMAIP